jgi:hypothetical protein
MDQTEEGDFEGILKRLLDEAETGLLRSDCWLMIMMMVMITKMLLIRTAAKAGGGFKFVVSLNIFTTVQCTESGVEGFNRVTPISSTHFLTHSWRSQLVFLLVALHINLSVLCPLSQNFLTGKYLTRKIDGDGYSLNLSPIYQITRRHIAEDSPPSYFTFQI